ncbi:PEP-CTERM sorting domain-containing protein [Candidatus Symbiobacter mobilis]|uniref:Ice-binding protein C-terminal domain-containing protein n=1 Tax=Candidatus Symbiobacter mobilis CR TaxID=946483 RepID=U5N7M3_9BURK|nr:PEP-CTERM sorting domain-containing protein [Candidatus Symbiobacter mobilis]AGX86194.1 hypothetical protein Cenrod_0059 [Candidatus Symbiobacter mobilis CR]
MKNFSIIALCLAVMTSFSVAHAQLVETDWVNSGDKLLTLDTVTGRKWLDLTQTYNWSVDMVRAELPSFTVATSESVYQLFQHAGVTLNSSCDPFCDVYDSESILTSMQQKLSYSGWTWGFITQGFVLDQRGENGVGLAAFSHMGNENQVSFYGLWIPSSYPGNGHSVWAYLDSNTPVLSPVPEPETYVMVLAGLGMICGIVRRRKAKQA